MYQYFLYGTSFALGGSLIYNLVNKTDIQNLKNNGLVVGLGLGCYYAYKIQK